MLGGSGKQMAFIFRIGRTYNPNCTKLKLAIDGGVIRAGAPAHKIFHGFSAEQVTTALKGTPIVMVHSPRQWGKTIAGPVRLDLMDAQTLS